TSGNLKRHLIAGYRHHAPLLVLDLNRDHRDILAVGRDRGAVGPQHKFGRCPYGLAPGSQNLPASTEASRFERARRELHLPLDMRVAYHFLASPALPVEIQLDSFQVRVDPNLYLLAFPALPIPVGEQVQDRLGSPPSLVVIIVVLGEATGIHDAKVRVDARPFVRRRLATIIESGPGEAAGNKRALVVNPPPRF